jgi:hypothetical protein
MTATLILALAMQLVVAAKAGLVNYVQGTTNVKATQLVPVASPILTGPNGYVELLLTPGSYLRMGNNAEVVLDNVELSNVAVRIVQGVAIVEVVDIDHTLPIQMTTGNVQVKIADPGIYEFGNGHATVIEGRLQAIDSETIFKKGWQVSFSGTYMTRKVSDSELSALDIFSKTRSERIAAANMDLAPVVKNSGYHSNAPIWIYSPAYALWTFMPYGNARSPYGYRYRGFETIVYGGRSGAVASGNDTADSGPRAGSSGGSSSSSSSGGTFNSSGQATYGSPGGGGQRVTSGDYQTGKSPARPTP